MCILLSFEMYKNCFDATSKWQFEKVIAKSHENGDNRSNLRKRNISIRYPITAALKPCEVMQK